jgi:hypothetical protein
MAMNPLGPTPGPRIRTDPGLLCERCGHHADAHHNPASCSVRTRWWRRCRCTGYARTDPAAGSQTGAGPR